MKTAVARKKQRNEHTVGALPNAVTLALGNNLKRFRKAAEKTQVELAFDAEVERSRISKIEGGHVNPSLLTLATLCHCLGITLPELFAGINETMAPSSEGGKLRRKNQAVLNKVTRGPQRRRTA
ncbi:MULTISPECIES: helix-turn-helix domain-containing protein [unclassified Variovorax]|uniref:helix-turn-helix domain-containing protein n=1 Tax=unclassified Variovorax TaxID=663243 RepID=UPI0032E6ACA7